MDFENNYSYYSTKKLNLNIYKLDENILSELSFSSFITCVEVYTSDLKFMKWIKKFDLEC